MTKETIILELNLDTSDFTKAAAASNAEIKRLTEQQRQLKKNGEEGSIQFQKNSEALRANRKELRETNKVIDTLTIANKSNAGSNEQLKAQLSLTTLEYNLLGKEQRENSARGKELNAQINQLTSELKSNEEGVGNNRRSVGDYERGTAALESQLSSLRKEFKSLTEEEKKNNDVGGVLIAQISETKNELVTTEKELASYNELVGASSEEASSFGDSLKGTPFGEFNDGIKSTGAALKANPAILIFTTIIGLLALLRKAFTRTEEDQNKFAKASAVVGALFNLLLDTIREVAINIIDVFSKPQEAIKSFSNLVKENIINRFEGLLELVPQLSKAIGLLFSGEFSEAGKVATDAVAKVALGVEDITGKFSEASKAAGEFTDKVLETAEAGARLADIQARLANEQRRARLIQLQFLKDAELQRQIRDDESKSIEERIKANQDLGKILQEQSKQELAIANLALRAASERIKIEGRTTEALDERADALVEIADIQERITGQESEQLTNINSLRKEQAELLVDIADQELKAFVDSNRSKIEANQFLNDELFNQEVERLEKIAQKEREFQQKRLDEQVISQQEFNNAINDVNAENEALINDLESKKAEADREKAIVDLANQREIDLINREDEFELRRQDSERQLAQELIDAETSGANVALIKEKFAAIEEQIDKDKRNAQLSEAQAVFGALSSLASGNAEAEKAFAISSSLINAYQSITAVLAAKSTIPEPFGSIAKGIQATAIGVSAFSNVNKIRQTNVPKAAKGAVFSKLKGRPHSQGGVELSADGVPFAEAEGDELVAVINKNSTAMLAGLSNINEAGGGVPFFNNNSSPTFENGGIAFGSLPSGASQSGANIEQAIVEGMSNVQIVTVVQDINEKQSDAIEVETISRV